MRLPYTKVVVVVVLLASLVLVAGGGYALDVLVNQNSYERYGPKVFRAQASADYAGNGTFTVKTSGGVDTFTGTLVRKGGLWNKYYWEGDFSSLTTDGDYYVYANVNGDTGNSYTFNVGVGSLLAGTGVPCYQYFTAQRCGQAVSFTYQNRAGQQVNWSHNLCHTDDGYGYPSGPYIDTAGGWHDSGEYQKYGQFFGSHAVYDLLALYDSNRSYFDSKDVNSNGIADILDEVIYQARWLAKMVDGSGHVRKQISKRRSGASWVKPEDDTDRVIGTSDDRWVEAGDCNTPTEIITSCVLIKTHIVLASKGINTENFASKGYSIWQHRVALANQQGGHNNLGSAAHQIWAGLDLYSVYSDQDCRTRALNKITETADGINANPASYDTAIEGLGYDLWALASFARNNPSQQPQAGNATNAVNALMGRCMELANDPVGLIQRNLGGSIQYFPLNPELGINRCYGTVTMGAVEAYRLTGKAEYLRFAMDQFNWILGSNYHRTCLMEAVGDSYLNKYHTRYDTFIANGIEPGVVVNGHIRDGSNLPWLDFGTGSVSAQTNESWLPNSGAYAAGLAGTAVFSSSNQSPYSGVINLPGTIQAENFDNGGDGIAYRDMSAGNTGGQYRSTNVDIEGCSEGGYNVGWIDTGEWLDYTVNPNGGTYSLLMRVASPGGGSFHILMNGKNVCGVTSVPNTGGWQTWQTVTISGVNLDAGQQTLTVYVDSGGWNFNYLQVTGGGGATNNAQVISETIPSTMTVNQQYNVSVTMQNTGTTTWTNAAGYKLGAVGDSDPFCAFTRVLLGGGDSIAPTQQKTFSFTMTAPGTAGTYTTDWRMVKEGVEWFGGTHTEQVVVSGSDTTAPTFGGSINPSTVNTLTPTITITAQDTGSGLNVGSSEFAYSVDGGATFCTYIGRYTLHSKGTGGGGGNMYWYPDFYHPASYTIANGDHLQYDIYIKNTDGKGAVDLEGSFGNLRDSGITDQNGLSAHANTNIYSYAYNQWYHRDFNLSSKAGHTITAYEMAHETDSGVSEFYVRNVIITNNGQVKDKAANADGWSAVGDTVGPGNNGYSSTVGPEMLTSDPASPASCTGSNGTTAQQTVSAVFSNRMMPLVTGGSNRIKYHINDMAGNRATSGTFTLTVDLGGQTPYAGVIAIPGTIQAENFDNGGEGVAYHDTSSGNSGGQYRSTDVDIEVTSDTGGGYNVGWIVSGEWLEYTVNVASTGDYDFYVRLAGFTTGSGFQIKIDNVDITGTRLLDSTGGAQSWSTFIVPSRYLTAGQHVLQFYVVTGGFNFNKIDVYSRGADAVSCDLGGNEVFDGMTHIQVGDGDTVPWSSAGHRLRENVDYPDLYMYFGVADAWAYQGSKQDVYITFDYYDLGSGQLGLDYDSTSSSYQHVNGPNLTNTGTIKQYTFHVTNAYFGNRQNGGADFRITGIWGEWGVDTVCVYQ